MKNLYYIISNGLPVPEPDLEKWAIWFESHRVDRILCRNTLPHEIIVSTVFLGLDHQYLPDRPPLLYETLIIGGDSDGEITRYSTKDEALSGHEEIVQRLTKVTSAVAPVSEPAAPASL